nr:relaxase/mobilization nuclease domain-containing protein [Campylobacter hyointestinalis]
MNYLLNNRVEKGTARILQGDEDITRDLINSMSQKHKTCVGCLSFEEKNIDEDTKKEIMRDFENMLLTPAMQGRYNILWVEHTDKKRLELNFVIPKIDLQSKTALNPYFHMADSKRKDLWTDYVNLKHNFTDPKNPAKQNTLQGSKKEYELIKDYQELDKLLHEQVKQGNISSRDEIIQLLKENSIEVTRQGKDYLSIKLPDSKKAKRFKGSIYDEQFTSTKELKSINTRQSERERAYNERDNETELRRLEKELAKFIQSKYEFYISRDKKRALQFSKRADKTKDIKPINELYYRDNDSNNFLNDCVVAVDNAKSNSKRIRDSREFEQTRRLDDNSDRQDRNDTRQQEIQSDKNQIRAENDSIRERINKRNREIAERTRECLTQLEKSLLREQELLSENKNLQNELEKLENEFKESLNRLVTKLNE